MNLSPLEKAVVDLVQSRPGISEQTVCRELDPSEPELHFSKVQQVITRLWIHDYIEIRNYMLYPGRKA